MAGIAPDAMEDNWPKEIAALRALQILRFAGSRYAAPQILHFRMKDFAKDFVARGLTS